MKWNLRGLMCFFPPPLVCLWGGGLLGWSFVVVGSCSHSCVDSKSVREFELRSVRNVVCMFSHLGTYKTSSPAILQKDSLLAVVAAIPHVDPWNGKHFVIARPILRLLLLYFGEAHLYGRSLCCRGGRCHLAERGIHHRRRHCRWYRLRTW